MRGVGMPTSLLDFLRIGVLSSLILVSNAAVFRELRENGFQVLVPSDAQYANASLAFNRRFDLQPVAIVYPVTTQDVADAVSVGASYDLRVVARSGGHSYIANGLGGKNGSLVIDLSNFNTVSYDAATEVAAIGPGNRLGDVALALNYNGRALPHGTCPYVGIGGHSGYGGYGFTSRKWGLTLDTIVGLEVVLANGTIVNASETAYPDLFWGLRGSSSSFGIVTQIYAKTYAAPPSATIFQYNWDLSTSDAASAFQAFQNYTLAPNLPTEWGAEIVLGQGSQKDWVSFGITGGWYAPPEEFEAVITPLLNSLPTEGRTDNVTVGSYIESVDILGGIGYLNTTGKPDDHDTFYVKSLMTPQFAPIGAEAGLKFMEYLGNEGFDADTDWFVEIELYGGINSAINAVSFNTTSFAHRSSLFTIQFYTSSDNNNPPFPSQGFALLDGMVDTIVDNSPADWDYGAYTNYIDDRLKNWSYLYYGQHYKKLRRLKRKYDPQNTFSFPLSIGE